MNAYGHLQLKQQLKQQKKNFDRYIATCIVEMLYQYTYLDEYVHTCLGVGPWTTRYVHTYNITITFTLP